VEVKTSYKPCVDECSRITKLTNRFLNPVVLNEVLFVRQKGCVPEQLEAKNKI